MPTDITSADMPVHHDDSAEPGTGFAYALATVLIALWAGSIAAFGMPGLFMPAVIATPVMLITLVAISRG